MTELKTSNGLAKVWTVIKKLGKKLFKKKPTVFSVVCACFLWIFSLSLLFLFAYAFVNSFKSMSDFMWNPVGMPEKWETENYIHVLNYFRYQEKAHAPFYYIEDMIGFTLLYCFGCTLANLTIVTVTAYVTARFDYKFSGVVYTIVLVTMSLPLVGSQASELHVVKTLNLYNTFIGSFVLKANFLSLYYMVFHATFKGVGKSYSEAAEIDGAGNLRIFISIMLPLVKNTLMTIGLIYFIQYWNDYQTPLLYLPAYPTIALGLYQFKGSTIPDIASPTIKLGASILVFLPIFIVFLIFQNRIIGNVSIGGVKE